MIKEHIARHYARAAVPAETPPSPPRPRAIPDRPAATVAPDTHQPSPAADVPPDQPRGRPWSPRRPRGP